MTSIKATLCTLMCLAIAMACTETEIIPAPELPGDRVLEFTVVNTPDPIHGVVNHADSTIKVYLPYYYFLQSMQAEVTLPKGTTVSPASGTLIENLSAILRGNTELYYTVTATDGSKTPYQVIFDTQQPVLAVEEVTTDAGSPAEFNSSMLYLGKYFIAGTIPLTGANFIRGITGEPLSRVWFVSDATGAKIPAYATTSTVATTMDVILPLMEDIPPGMYHIQVDCYTYSITLANAVKINNPM